MQEQIHDSKHAIGTGPTAGPDFWPVSPSWHSATLPKQTKVVAPLTLSQSPTITLRKG